MRGKKHIATARALTGAAVAIALTLNAQAQTDHSVKMNSAANQMLLRTTGGEVKYYNTADLSEVNIDKESGTVSVSPKTADWNDRFTQNVTAISFTKGPETGEDAEIVNRGVRITEAKGWLEAAYVKWEPLAEASGYRVYIKGGKYADYTQLDRELVRNYGSYGRADMVGLAAGDYSMKVVPVINGAEDENLASEAMKMSVRPHERSGFAHHNFSGIGAYTDGGEDAAIHGFGMLVRNCSSVEMRNFGIYWFMDDGISLDTDNSHIWIHHLDIFYGQPGKDKDQVKGDGSVDVKGDSQYITFANLHFFDSGKMSLCGMKSETGPNYIDYHGNWFDHTDSRHPRIRTMSVHVWNNYYDGVAKYGVGATTGASAFVERNFFRATKNPMLISRQGTDAAGSGTFSNEPGGMIKSFGNLYAEKGSGKNYTPVTHSVSATDFDCYEASARDETVPDSYTAKAGGSKYDNFDTNPALMYDYRPLDAADVPAYVMGFYGAGRLNKGDFKWNFDSTTADTDYELDTALQAAVRDYTSSLVGISE